jgi:hypothetical protein
MTHSELLAAIMLTNSRGNTRLLRANAGRGWTGKIVHQTPTLITLSPYRPFHGMHEGVLDSIGWSPWNDADGTAHAIFTAIDAKVGSDRVRPAQQAFIDVVLTCGGRAGVARSLDDAHQILTGEVK